MVPSVSVWVLTFYVATGQPFVGGEYQDEWRCEQAAKEQFEHWRIVYGRRLTWRCELVGK